MADFPLEKSKKTTILEQEKHLHDNISAFFGATADRSTAAGAGGWSRLWRSQADGSHPDHTDRDSGRGFRVWGPAGILTKTFESFGKADTELRAVAARQAEAIPRLHQVEASLLLRVAAAERAGLMDGAAAALFQVSDGHLRRWGAGALRIVKGWQRRESSPCTPTRACCCARERALLHQHGSCATTIEIFVSFEDADPILRASPSA